MNDSTLLAWLSGGLEPGEAAEVEARMRADPALSARMMMLRTLTTPVETADRWRIPPPGLPGSRHPVAMTAQSMTMSEEPIGALSGFSIRITPPSADTARWVVVLQEVDGRWGVVFPNSAEERIRLSELPREPDGTWLLEMVAGEVAGRQRWAVALPEDDARWEEDEPWRVLKEAIAAGEVPVTAVSIMVQ